jgi:hypothetical protein
MPRVRVLKPVVAAEAGGKRVKKPGIELRARRWQAL